MVPILTNQQWKPQHGKMSVARPMGWFLVSISDPKTKESEVHGWRQCESLLFSLSSIAAWHQLCWCILFVQHMSPSENCHIQAHVAFTARAQLAVPKAQESSTRSQTFAAGYCCPYSGSWPPSDLVPDRCMLQRVPGCVVRSFPQTIAVKPPLLAWSLCFPLPWRVHVWLGRPGASWIATSTGRLARGQPRWCTTLGGLPNK